MHAINYIVKKENALSVIDVETVCFVLRTKGKVCSVPTGTYAFRNIPVWTFKKYILNGFFALKPL